MLSPSRFSWLLLCCCLVVLSLRVAAQQTTAPKPSDKPADADTKPADAPKTTDLNLLGKTEAASGESRRNENVQFNLIDNNSLKEANLRLGTTATIINEFKVEQNYFGSEFGSAPKAALTIPAAIRAGSHGELRFKHLNSIFSARSFFQVGPVKPARENDYGFNVSSGLWRNAKLFVDAGQNKIRGNVNGNVLVPKSDERTPLATDPVARVIIARFLAAYPKELPNRTEINERALNTNAPQTINNHQANFRLDQSLGSRDNLLLQYQFVNQQVLAFQFVAGQNPNTDTKSHLARIVWTRQWSAATLVHLTASYDRVTSVLQPETNAVGPFVLIAGLTGLGPDGSIPIDRAQNQIRYAAQVNRLTGAHQVTYGVSVLRRQLNGSETDVHRGFFSFNNDFGETAIRNLRLGKASQYILAVGNIHRGFRNWDFQFFASDKWQINSRLSLHYGVRYQPQTRPLEVNRLNTVPFDNDFNNVAPMFGVAYRMPKNLGVLRTAGSVHFGEIFAPTFQQIRFSPPLNIKISVPSPDLVNPLNTPQTSPLRPTLYALSPDLALPYSYQYNLSWEPELPKAFARWAKLQVGYVGSRSHKLFVMWYTNRAHYVPGIEHITRTINDRRPNKDYADIRLVVNTSNGYFDAGRVSLVLSNWQGLTMDAAYWFSKAIDLGANYTNTAHENDSRSSRSQWEFENHRDMKGLSLFDQTHAFLWRVNYAVRAPKELAWAGKALTGWNLATTVLIKTGIPFNISTGSDGPNFGNVDGNGGDRPMLLNPAILGRTIADPDTSKQLLPSSAFAFIQCTTNGCPVPYGNLGRNVFRKGPIRNVNASLFRSWAVKQDLRLTFRVESINLFNTPQFAEPGFELANPNFGAITNTLNDGRTFRFGLQVGW